MKTLYILMETEFIPTQGTLEITPYFIYNNKKDAEIECNILNNKNNKGYDYIKYYYTVAECESNVDEEVEL